MLYEIEFPLANLSSEAIEAALLEVGARSITFLDRGDEPVLEPRPGEIRLWSDTLVRALFDETQDAAATVGRLSLRLGAGIMAPARIHAVEPRDWERAWRAGWKSMKFGRRLWISPALDEAPEDPAAIVVRLDPGLAFGTGAHPTTALCLQLLDALPLAGRAMIDFGCGSGILAIAALKLGATRASAVDLDPQALIATRDNATRNAVADRIDVQGVPAVLQPADLVVANILADPLIELAPVLSGATRPGGDLVLSGLLKSQAYAVKAAYTPGFDILQVFGRDEWCCIHARKKA